MVDAADPEKIEASKNELHNLLDKPQLQGIPVRTTRPQRAARTEPDQTDLKLLHIQTPFTEIYLHMCLVSECFYVALKES